MVEVLGRNGSKAQINYSIKSDRCQDINGGGALMEHFLQGSAELRP